MLLRRLLVCVPVSSLSSRCVLHTLRSSLDDEGSSAFFSQPVGSSGTFFSCSSCEKNACVCSIRAVWRRAGSTASICWSSERKALLATSWKSGIAAEILLASAGTGAASAHEEVERRCAFKRLRFMHARRSMSCGILVLSTRSSMCSCVISKSNSKSLRPAKISNKLHPSAQMSAGDDHPACSTASGDLYSLVPIMSGCGSLRPIAEPRSTILMHGIPSALIESIMMLSVLMSVCNTSTL
mmetsp:Transcript_14718/g.34946  ORF Transcript_14718/g.34946 Transcript_14718/m.34946 type:complete len:240 (+) Transcript_14718:459-1178(+)